MSYISPMSLEFSLLQVVSGAPIASKIPARLESNLGCSYLDYVRYFPVRGLFLRIFCFIDVVNIIPFPKA